VSIYSSKTVVSPLLTSPTLDQMIAAWENGQISSASPPDVSEFEQNLRVSFNRLGMPGYADSQNRLGWKRFPNTFTCPNPTSNSTYHSSIVVPVPEAGVLPTCTLWPSAPCSPCTR